MDLFEDWVLLWRPVGEQTPQFAHPPGLRPSTKRQKSENEMTNTRCGRSGPSVPQLDVSSFGQRTVGLIPGVLAGIGWYHQSPCDQGVHGSKYPRPRPVQIPGDLGRRPSADRLKALQNEGGRRIERLVSGGPETINE